MSITFAFNKDQKNYCSMTVSLKRNKFIQIFNSIHQSQNLTKEQNLLRMFNVLNKFNLKNENRLILCNFIDQYSDLLGINEDIYYTNHEKTIFQLYRMAYKRARESELTDFLHEEYIMSLKAISQKREF